MQYFFGILIPVQRGKRKPKSNDGNTNVLVKPDIIG